MKSIFTFLFFLVFTQFSFSQIVNIETKRKHEADTLGVFGYIDLGFNLVQNGSSILTTRNNAQLEFIKNNNRLLAISNFNFVRISNNNFVNNGFQHLRFNRTLNQRFTQEIFAQVQYNQRVRLKLRALAGIGIRATIIEKEKNNAYFGLAYMFEYNEIKDTSIIHRENRLSTYLSFEIKPTKTLKISGTTYFQPRFPSFTKARISSTTALHLKITQKLTFRVNFQVTHDGRLDEDSPGVTETFYSLSNSLRLNF